jgi:hypothetical protein
MYGLTVFYPKKYHIQFSLMSVTGSLVQVSLFFERKYVHKYFEISILAIIQVFVGC